MDKARTAAGRYKQLEPTRAPFLRRARRCATLTIPALMPPEGYSGSMDLGVNYQSIGARGVNNLASKFTLTLLPPSQPFFRAIPSFMDLEELKQQDSRLGVAFETALSKYERAIQSEIDTSNDRVGFNEGAKHILVCGNVILYDQPEGGLKCYNLSQFVQKCDPSGAVIEMVIKEQIDPFLLPPGVQTKFGEAQDDRTKIDAFIWVRRVGDHWEVHQEIYDQVVPGSQGTYPLDAPAFIPLGFTDKNGLDYSRSYVDEYLGDLISHDGLSKAILEGSVGSARALVLVNPNGLTRMKDVAEAPNWAVRPGRADDVTVLQAQKSADLSFTQHQLDRLEKRLEAVFLLNSAVQRDAERVTAEEIRFMAQELETIMGGQYTLLGSTFQLPYVRRKINRMERKNKLPVIPKNLIRLTIITGLDALGRTADLQRLDVAYTMAQKHLGPEAVVQFTDVPGYLAKIFNSAGVDKEGLIKDEEEMAAEQQAAQDQALMSQISPELVRQAGGVVQAAMKDNGGNNVE